MSYPRGFHRVHYVAVTKYPRGHHVALFKGLNECQWVESQWAESKWAESQWAESQWAESQWAESKWAESNGPNLMGRISVGPI